MSARTAGRALVNAQPPADVRVEMALLAQMQRLLQRITLTAPVAVAVFVVAAWDVAARPWLVAYGVFALAMCVFTFWQIAYESRARAAGRLRFRAAVRLLALNMAVSSVGWGSISWLARSGPLWLQAAAGVYVVGFLAANMAFNAPTRVLFHIFQTPLVVVAVTGELATGGTLGRLLAVVIVVFAGNATSLHSQLHAVHREAVHREIGNADMVERLRRQQRHLDAHIGRWLRVHERSPRRASAHDGARRARCHTRRAPAAARAP